MTRTEQTRFITGLCRNIANSVAKAVAITPETEAWDGHELREYLADQFERSAAGSALRIYPRTQRTRNYKKASMLTDHNRE